MEKKGNTLKPQTNTPLLQKKTLTPNIQQNTRSGNTWDELFKMKYLSGKTIWKK